MCFRLTASRLVRRTDMLIDGKLKQWGYIFCSFAISLLTCLSAVTYAQRGQDARKIFHNLNSNLVEPRVEHNNSTVNRNADWTHSVPAASTVQNTNGGMGSRQQNNDKSVAQAERPRSIQTRAGTLPVTGTIGRCSATRISNEFSTAI
jgi:hypothetical protein